MPHAPGDASECSNGLLTARELDAERTFAAERERYRDAVDRLFDSLRRGALDAAYDRAVVQDLIDLAPPGLDELFAILAITDALEPEKGVPAYDVVVVDTAPTGHALRMLQMPRTALEWIKAFLAILLKYRKVVGLGDLAADLVDTSRRLRRLDALLRDPGATRACAVTRAAALPALETRRLIAALEEMAIPVGALIVNAVSAPACPRCRRAAAAEAPHLRALAASSSRAGCAMLQAPAWPTPPRGVDDLRRWFQTWTP